MIVTELYNGQGLGNQLWCYAVSRTIALDNGFEFSVKSPEKFKAKHFMNIDFGNTVVGGFGPEGGSPHQLPEGISNYYKECLVRNSQGIDVSKFDEKLLNVPDNTKIDGGMQSEKYIEHRRSEIVEWFKPNTTILNYSSDNICLIHFRGGDYKFAGSTLLPFAYYKTAMNKMLEMNPNMKFCVVTDDLRLATDYFGNQAHFVGSCLSNSRDINQADFHIGGDLSVDYSILNNAKNMILSNSSFSWWSAWTNTNVKNVIAPKYWAAYNFSNGFWSCGDALTKGWLWLDRFENLFTYNECKEFL